MPHDSTGSPGIKSLRFVLALIALTSLAPLHADDDFMRWLEELREEAASKGISQATLNAALHDVRPIERVIELDRRQPEFTETFWNYLDKRVTTGRVTRGRRLLAQHHALLEEVERQFGVPPRYLVAFWGLETNFGAYLGKFPTVDALVTLAYDPRRSKFFRTQALDALLIIEQGHVAAHDMKGSWAGAIGQLQFLPSTFLGNAFDGNGDGKKDVWHNLSDVFYSGGNYLWNIGWRRGERWGREVSLPADFAWEDARLDFRKPIAYWSARGVRRADGGPLPTADLSGAIVLPQGHNGPAFLVYENFNVIMKWNRSIHYALSVGILADRFMGGGKILHGRDADNRRLTRQLTLELQQLLNSRGFDVGEPDGIPGYLTRKAVRAYQMQARLPADGYPSVSLLEHLRRN